MKYKILLVEDQREIIEIIAKYLKREGYYFTIAKDGFEALEQFSKFKYHLILLDIMMPGIDGYEVLRRIREISDIPIIMVTAKQEEIDRLKGFDDGADDYVIKPFSVKELIRRIKVIFKRVYNEKDEIIYKCCDLLLNTNQQKLIKNNREILITANEYKLLNVLFQNQGQILSREQIIQKTYGYDFMGSDRSIDTYIKRIRYKIEDDPKDPKILITKYGAGYIFGVGKS